VIERETGRLGRLASYSGLIRWRNALIAASALQNGAYGCALGSMASEVADHDEQARIMGGYLLANTAHDVRPMEISIDVALEHVRAYLAAQ
jgi:TetR/AcrR family transcriptional repressor of nem operon